MIRCGSSLLSVAPLQILAVEDTDEDFYLLQVALSDCLASFELNRIADGGEAVRFLRQLGASADKDRPDLVLLDLNLPQINGLGVLEFIKSHDATRDIPVVIFTSSSDVREKNKALALRAEEFVTKPLSLDRMFAVVDELCKKYLSDGRGRLRED